MWYTIFSYYHTLGEITWLHIKDQERKIKVKHMKEK